MSLEKEIQLLRTALDENSKAVRAHTHEMGNFATALANTFRVLQSSDTNETPKSAETTEENEETSDTEEKVKPRMATKKAIEKAFDTGAKGKEIPDDWMANPKLKEAWKEGIAEYKESGNTDEEGKASVEETEVEDEPSGEIEKSRAAEEAGETEEPSGELDDFMDEPEEKASGYTHSDIRDLARKKIQEEKVDRDVIKEIIAEHGGGTISELDEDKLDACYDAIDAL